MCPGARVGAWTTPETATPAAQEAFDASSDGEGGLPRGQIVTSQYGLEAPGRLTSTAADKERGG
jgi:hypothetical protein